MADKSIAEAIEDIKADVIKAEVLARDSTQAQEALRILQESIGSLSKDAFNIFVAQPEIQDLIGKANQGAGGKPGDPVFDVNGRQIGNVAYTYFDFCQIYPMHTWLPPRTNHCISINGVSIAVTEGEEVTTPKVFYDIEMESIRAERQAVMSQRHALLTSPEAHADGISHEVGWYKRTNEELIRIEGVQR